MDDWLETSDAGELVLSVLRPSLTEARHLAHVLEEGQWSPALGKALPHAVAAAREGDGRAEALRLVAMIAATASGREDVRFEVVPSLFELLTDRSRCVRQGVINVLAHFPGADVLSALQAHWADEPTRYVRLNLVLAIGKVGGPAALSWLDGRAQDDDPQVQLAALVTAAAISGEVTHLDLVRAAMADDLTPWQNVEFGAEHEGGLTWWLVTSLPTERLPVVEAMFEHANQDARRKAVNVLADMVAEQEPVDDLLPLFGALLKDTKAEVRARAAEVMAVRAPVEYADDVAELLGDNDTVSRDAQVRDFAMWALVRMGDPRCVDALNDRFADELPSFAKYESVTGPPLLHVMLADAVRFADDLIPMLTRHLVPGEANQVHEVTRLLTAWGPAAKPAEQALTRLAEADVHFRTWCEDALAAIAG